MSKLANMPMKPIPVRLPTDLLDRANHLRDKTGCPVAETVRRAVAEYLDKHQPAATTPAR